MDPARTYGDFTESVPLEIEGLTIVFSPTSVSLKERWKNNSLSADFMADYFATFYALHGSDEEGRLEYVKGAVSFVANELIENAMKFTDVEGIPISIRLTMHEGELVFFATNGASLEGSQMYESAVRRLLNADPWAEYERRAQANDGTSGLGLLSMLTDYSARLGWRFMPHDDKRLLLTTTVRIPL
ncbi:MAG: hypothetical protein JNJ46_14355 [Myxococcales bacterium]|nr:hypothetical protein [Myxococcales bacterium]